MNEKDQKRRRGEMKYTPWYQDKERRNKTGRKSDERAGRLPEVGGGAAKNDGTDGAQATRVDLAISYYFQTVQLVHFSFQIEQFE